ncbi:MAG TPA: tetratricopeptide repeat protein [Terriglobales bacterium]|nr:tetratricopeptide repeat protein [Terriglobales bacterium]
MRAETRHQLKQDRFSRTTIDVAEATVHWSVEHKNKLIAGVAVAVAVVALLLGGWYYLNQQDMKASAELSQAVRTLGTQVRPANMPAQPDFPSFASAKERATAAQTQLQKVIKDYPHSKSADFARYFLGVAALDLGDSAAAEKDFKEVAGVHNDDLASLANFALAAVYRNSGREKDAIDIYKKLADKPTRTVGKTTAQMELAATYQAAQQPAEAKRIYEQIQKENPNTEAAQLASNKAQEIK